LDREKRESIIFHEGEWKVWGESFLLKKIVIVLEGLRGHRTIAEIYRVHGISQGQYYKWRDKYWCKVCTWKFFQFFSSSSISKEDTRAWTNYW